MKDLPFVWRGIGSLAERLALSFCYLSIDHDDRRPYAIDLWHKPNLGTRIHNQMHDIAVRTEVGALDFSESAEPKNGSDEMVLPPAFHDGLVISKLVLFERDHRVESGISFKSARGQELIIVAAAFPYQLALEASWTHVAYQNVPEYELSRYARVPLE